MHPGSHGALERGQPALIILMLISGSHLFTLPCLLYLQITIFGVDSVSPGLLNSKSILVHTNAPLIDVLAARGTV